MKYLKLIIISLMVTVLTGCSLLPQSKNIQSNTNSESKEVICRYQSSHPDWRCYNGLKFAEIMLPSEFALMPKFESTFEKVEGETIYQIDIRSSKTLIKEGELIKHFQNSYATLCSEVGNCSKIEKWEYITLNGITYLKTHENVVLGIGEFWQEKTLFYRTLIDDKLYTLKTSSETPILESGQLATEIRTMIDEELMDQIVATFIPKE